MRALLFEAVARAVLGRYSENQGVDVCRETERLLHPTPPIAYTHSTFFGRRSTPLGFKGAPLKRVSFRFAVNENAVDPAYAFGGITLVFFPFSDIGIRII
jgi:hypothetical protein